MNHQDCAQVLLTAVKAAGKAILALQQTGFTISTKQHCELVTEADIKANVILKDQLLSAFPDDGWLSEETIDDHARLTAKRTWIVDPIDGTKEFAMRLPEYAISVALVEHHRPIVSAVFNPATNELFHAIKGAGAWCNGSRMICKTPDTTLHLLASRSEFERGEWQRFNTHEIKVVGSIAYKLALIANGAADATFSLGPKNEWDIAAGVLLVEEAGGIVTNRLQQPFRFNQADVSINGIIACATPVKDRIMRLIEDHD